MSIFIEAVVFLDRQSKGHYFLFPRPFLHNFTKDSRTVDLRSFTKYKSRA